MRPRAATLNCGSRVHSTASTIFRSKEKRAAGLTLLFDTLMARSLDQQATEYCLVCEWVSYPDDFSSVTFRIRKIARFNDGKPITADDVIFSLNAIRKAHPFYRAYYRNVSEVVKNGDHEVTFKFNAKGNRELPQIMGQLTVLPKHFWEKKGRNGKKRDLSKSTLEIPLGSGPYRVKSVDATREIVFERVKNWWAKDLPVTRGQWNFDRIAITYFRDKTPAFEAFKIGAVDYWSESSAKDWATRFAFGAARKGLVKAEVVPVKRVAGMQAFVMNLRRPMFKDVRVREAISLAFDFEWARKTYFFGQYNRLDSYFDNSELESRGLPAGKELEILNSVKDLVPKRVFSEVWKAPNNSSRDDVRANLKKASDLLDAAGWQIEPKGVCGIYCSLLTKVGLGEGDRYRFRRNANGQTLRVEFLVNYGSGFERVVLTFIRNLKLIGIDARIRIVDSAHMKRREQTFNFDIITDRFPQSNSPGNEQRDFFGSKAADRQGSRNTIGIKNPAVDKLIERIVFAKDRAELVAATRALDRVLKWNFYVVPQWYLPASRIAYWKRFGRPKKLPALTPGFLQIWWVDPVAEKTLQAARKK